MPPKRKAGGKAAPSAPKAKKAKAVKKEVEEPAAPETLKDKIAQLKAADKGKAKKHKPDTYCSLSSNAQVSQITLFCLRLSVNVIIFYFFKYSFRNSYSTVSNKHTDICWAHCVKTISVCSHEIVGIPRLKILTMIIVNLHVSTIIISEPGSLIRDLGVYLSKQGKDTRSILNLWCNGLCT